MQLSKGYDGKTLTRLDDLAQREAVSSNFLVQILNDLRRAGLIDSRRGASGGYLLSREPDKINMRQIVDAVEPAQLINTAVDQGESGSGVKQVWEDISVKLTKDLEKITLDSFSETQTMPDFSI